MQSRDNVCAERMLETAFQRVLGRQITFRAADNDAQIDLGPAFMAAEEGESKSWTSGHDKLLLEADFAALDPGKTYFMRTGIAQGAGHWQLLYCEADGWHGFSTMSNQKHYTRDGHLTKDGEGLMTHKGSAARWGQEAGQYSILIQEANEARLIAAANFVRDLRLSSEMIAIERAFNPELNRVLNTTDGFISERAVARASAGGFFAEGKTVAVDPKSVLETAALNFSSVVDKTSTVYTSDITRGKTFYLNAIRAFADAHPEKAKSLYEETLTTLLLMKESAGTSGQGIDAITYLSLEVNELLEDLNKKQVGFK